MNREDVEKPMTLHRSGNNPLVTTLGNNMIFDSWQLKVWLVRPDLVRLRSPNSPTKAQPRCRECLPFWINTTVFYSIKPSTPHCGDLQSKSQKTYWIRDVSSEVVTHLQRDLFFPYLSCYLRVSIWSSCTVGWHIFSCTKHLCESINYNQITPHPVALWIHF